VKLPNSQSTMDLVVNCANINYINVRDKRVLNRK